MYIVDRGLHLMREFLLSYGPTSVKKRIWDKEYSDNKWHFADNTAGDCVYRHLEKFAGNGSILDIGCGSGNTATEVAESAYTTYIGVDISEEALAKAEKRSKQCGRQAKNSFACSDFLNYVPTGQFDVILFRESVYHIPMAKIKSTLDRYAPYLKDNGVFIVRLFAGDRNAFQPKPRPTEMLSIIEQEFSVIEKKQYHDEGLPTVLVFRPKLVASSV